MLGFYLQQNVPGTGELTFIAEEREDRRTQQHRFPRYDRVTLLHHVLTSGLRLVEHPLDRANVSICLAVFASNRRKNTVTAAAGTLDETTTVLQLR